MTVFTLVLWIAIIGWGIWELVQYFRRKNVAPVLSKEEFKEKMRKAQIVDVRSADDFDAGHILGARNIPYMQMKQRANELRKDQPVYLYDEKRILSARSAIILKKLGYQDLYILKGGYADWDGKIKRTKR